ncbi:MAG: indole-3-glycerol-phosphate synthase TrpC, partial [Acidobacteria bacterium]
AVGYDAFLIGESLMKAASPGQALRTLMKDAVAEKASAN